MGQKYKGETALVTKARVMLKKIGIMRSAGQLGKRAKKFAKSITKKIKKETDALQKKLDKPKKAKKKSERRSLRMMNLPRVKQQAKLIKKTEKKHATQTTRKLNQEIKKLHKKLFIAST